MTVATKTALIAGPGADPARLDAPPTVDRRRNRPSPCYGCEAVTEPCQPAMSFRTLHESPIVAIKDYECHACRGGPGPEESSTEDVILFMRNGAFSRHFGRRSVTADVNQTAFFPRGSVYRVSHPADFGDRGTTLRVQTRILREIIHELAPTAGEGAEPVFPFACGPCEPGVFWHHRELIRRLEAAPEEPLEPLWVEVSALQLTADVLEGAFARYGALPRARRPRTASSHADLAEAAKAYLSGRIADRPTLDEVAWALATFPFHLARIFQRRTGVSLHRYLTLLRLRAALDRLADGDDDLTALALDLGFSSHSHFADAFKREFGRSPSDARRDLTPRVLRKMSKNLKA
jgi:AraC family transcriptional regulator